MRRHILDGLPLRLLLAALSGLACGLYVAGVFEVELGPLDYGLPGALFGACVLCPYLRKSNGRIVVRAIALMALSGLSFWAGIRATLDVGSWLGFNGALGPFGLRSFLLGSFVGAGIVLVAGRYLIPLRTTAAYWLFGAAAALLGGAGVYVGIEVMRNDAGGVAAFALWHVLLCLAIYLGAAQRLIGAASPPSVLRAEP